MRTRSGLILATVGCLALAWAVAHPRRSLPAPHPAPAVAVPPCPLPPQGAVKSFSDGEVELVLDGRLTSLPLADVGPLSRGTVRLDAAQGIMGLRVGNTEGLLADPARGEALAMGIERVGFGWYLRRIAPLALAAYLAGAMVYLAQSALVG